MTPNIPLHPDDVLLFNEVAGVMRKVAAHYKLPLRSITPYPMPTQSMADRLGDCSTTGDIRLVMRATVDGQFVDAPRSPDAIWKTAAHELSHLRHFRHGLEHQTFQLELEQALTNHKVDHRQKVLDRLVKLQASREGEARLGNEAAAEAFASLINKMLIEHELNPSDIDYARAADNDPVIQLTVNLSKYRIPEKRVRIAWQEQLARIVADAHLCRFLVRTGSNLITFVGTTSHATVAEYVFGTLVPAANHLCGRAYHEYGLEGSTDGKWRAREPGFKESWLAAFIGRIEERFADARQAAVAAATADVPGGESTALIRLSGQLAKASKYIDDKFIGKAAPIQRISGYHREGRARGRAAADAMTIGRRGVTGGRAPKALLS